MNLINITDRIKNIAKGKIAEGLFFTFCKHNGIIADYSRCNTPFYTIDKRDFILDNYEWDIKNNFIIHNNKVLADDYTNLPALVPDRFNRDQWSKRNEMQHNGLSGVRLLFSFMKRDEIFKMVLTDEQDELIRKIYSKYKGQTQNAAPFDTDEFWNAMIKKGGGNKYMLQIINRPYLVITGYAGREEFKLFRKQKPGAFLNGAFRTRIINRNTEIRTLPSFATLYPHLKHKMYYAEFRKTH